MKEVLDKVRLEYRDDYERFITKMERETDEVRVLVVLVVVCEVARREGLTGNWLFSC